MISLIPNLIQIIAEKNKNLEAEYILKKLQHV